MNITSRPPLGLKAPKPAKDRRCLAAVAALPCVICHEYGLPQLSPTQVHHVIMGRGGNRKTPDAMAIPLCEGHHQGNFDTSKIAIHREPALWREAYGPDTDYISRTQDAIAGQLTGG